MPLHWFEVKEGERGVNQRHYVEVMESVVMPWIQVRLRWKHISGTHDELKFIAQETYSDNDIVYCFQQVSFKQFLTRIPLK